MFYRVEHGRRPQNHRDFLGLRYNLDGGISAKTLVGDSGSSAHSGRGGSSPPSRTKKTVIRGAVSVKQ